MFVASVGRSFNFLYVVYEIGAAHSKKSPAHLINFCRLPRTVVMLGVVCLVTKRLALCLERAKPRGAAKPAIACAFLPVPSSQVD